MQSRLELLTIPSITMVDFLDERESFSMYALMFSKIHTINLKTARYVCNDVKTYNTNVN